MAYLKPSSSRESGLIVADVMIALALAALFVSGVTALSLEAQEIYRRADIRDGIVSAYSAHAGEFEDLMPYESRRREYQASTSSEPVVVQAYARWYGNDRIETDISARQYGQTVSLRAVRNYPFVSVSDAAGTPLCSPELVKGGTFMADIAPIVLPINPLLPLTDIEVRNGIAYVSADPSVSADPDLIIADIKDAKAPRVLSSINTGPGLRSIAIAGRYVFAAAASTAAQLHVIRLDSLAAPVLAKKYQVPMATPTTTPAMGSAISYSRGLVYLGTERWSGKEFSIVDVADAANPRVLGGFDVDSKANDIVVRDGSAYVASASKDQIQTIDIRDPSRPALSYGLSPSGWQRQEGQALASFESSVHAGRTSGGFDISADHELFSWPPASSTPLSLNIPGGVYGILADRDRLYLATRNIDKELTIIDRSFATSTARYYPLPVAPRAMTCDGDRLYILANNAPAIYEITLRAQ